MASTTEMLIAAALEETKVKIGGNLDKGKILATLAIASAIVESANKTGDK